MIIFILKLINDFFAGNLLANPVIFIYVFKHQASSIKHQASSIKHQASSIKHQASSIKHQAADCNPRTPSDYFSLK